MKGQLDRVDFERMKTIGIDLGGTSVRVALVDEAGAILTQEKTATESEKGVEAFLEKVAGMVERVIGEEEVSEIGLGSPGPLNPFDGVILDPPNLVGWENVKLKALLEARTGLRVTLDNDANAAALAEAKVGAGKAEESLVYITVSTGVGAGIILGGNLYVGAQGNAGEIGNMVVQPGGRAQGNLNAGSLEGLASGTAIGRMGEEILGATGDAKEVFDRAMKGEEAAKKIIDEAVGFLAIGVANLANSFNPSVFVFGGGVMQQEMVLPLLTEKVRTMLYPSMKRHLNLRKADLGTEAGVIGAAFLPRVSRLK
ncbi:ROK family protein [Alteribacter populi]|uniref:ROK family protein n=1 Tax=Alteribacter populi TaxID=2011011 RepID=UPI001E5F39E7|nr:ROK family protein [Alteribacter populi]